MAGSNAAESSGPVELSGSDMEVFIGVIEIQGLVYLSSRVALAAWSI